MTVVNYATVVCPSYYYCYYSCCEDGEKKVLLLMHVYDTAAEETKTDTVAETKIIT